MAGQERRLSNRPCPRFGCAGTVMTGDNSKYNAVSLVDGKQICTGCSVSESIERIIHGVS